MKRLIALQDVALAHEVLHRLQQESIESALTSEARDGATYTGVRHAVIWIDEQADEQGAIDVYRRTVEELTFSHCPHCKYDLRGHEGPMNCPECGRPLSAPLSERTCPDCGEIVPSNFDVCWNCGTDMTNVDEESPGESPMTANRLATSDDLPAILEISNHYALTTPANFAIEPESLDDWKRDFNETHDLYPWFVAIDDSGGVLGFAKASPWKGRCAYSYAAEISVYIHPDHHRKGLGRALYQKLLDTMLAQGFRTALGGITQPNPASVALHESLGMKRVALLKRIGWKFNQWHDVGYWQLQLQPEPDAPPTPLRPVREVLN